jgi:hypothetical protein
MIAMSAPGENDHYIELCFFTITGPLSIPALVMAIREIVHRHEALRTTFQKASDDSFKQVIHSAEEAADSTIIVVPEKFSTVD